MKSKIKFIRRLHAATALTAALLAPAIWAGEAPPTIQWQKSFGGTNYDFLTALQQTDDGGYVLGGFSLSGISGNKTSTDYGHEDYWVVKVDADGNKVWENSFGGSGRDYVEGQSIQRTSDGGYIVGGSSDSDVSGNKTAAGFGDLDYWVVKLDADGNKVWDKSFGGRGPDTLTCLLRTSDDCYLLGGYSSSGVSGNKTSAKYGGADCWIVKLDAGGNKIWDKSFGGDANNTLHAIQQTTDGGYVLGGYSTSGPSGNKTSTNYGAGDYWIVKLDATGNVTWDKSFGGAQDDLFRSLRQTSSGGYILGGASFSFPSGNKTSPYYYDPFQGGPDYWAIKLDAGGNIVWDKSFGGTGHDYLFSVQQNSSGYVLGGFSTSDVSGNKTTPNLGLGSFDYWLVKVTENGDKVWDASFGGNDGDNMLVVQQTSTGYILGGTSQSGVSGNKTSANFGEGDFWIVKLEGPPRITTQPQSWSVAVGETIMFSATVVGASPLTYQWLFNGTNIAGANGPTLTLTNTTHAQAGFYSVIVTNDFGTVTSVRAQLAFNFLTLRMYAGLTIDGEIGQTYRIEYLPVIEGQNNWRSLAVVTLTNTPYLHIDRDAPISAQRFYRALLVP